MISTRKITTAQVDLEIRRDDFDRAQIEKSTKGLNNYKAPGFDYNITAEAIKYGRDELAVRLLKLVNVIKAWQKPASDWAKNLIIPLLKKGGLTEIINYRGISLMSIAAKLYNKLLLNRIRDKRNASRLTSRTGLCRTYTCSEKEPLRI